jgi:hypothetical protein
MLNAPCVWHVRQGGGVHLSPPATQSFAVVVLNRSITSMKRRSTTTCGRDWTSNRGTRPERGYCWRACKLEGGSSCEDGTVDGRSRRHSDQGLGTKKPSNTTQKAEGKLWSAQHNAQHASARGVCRPRTACTLETTRRRVATVAAGSVYPAIVITTAHGFCEPGSSS